MTRHYLFSWFSGLFGKKIGVTGSHIITITCLLLSSILASIAFYEVVLSDSPVYIYITSWVDSEILNISWEFLFDSLSVYFVGLLLSETGAVLVLIQLYKNIFIGKIFNYRLVSLLRAQAMLSKKKIAASYAWFF